MGYLLLLKEFQLVTDRVTKTQIVNKPFKNDLEFCQIWRKVFFNLPIFKFAALEFAIFVEKEISWSSTNIWRFQAPNPPLVFNVYITKKGSINNNHNWVVYGFRIHIFGDLTWYDNLKLNLPSLVRHISAYIVYLYEMEPVYNPYKYALKHLITFAFKDLRILFKRIGGCFVVGIL